MPRELVSWFDRWVRGLVGGRDEHGLPLHQHAVDLLAARAPTLDEAVRAASTKAYVLLDGTLLPIDRIAADQPFYSGKHKKHGMNVAGRRGSVRPAAMGLARTARGRSRRSRGPRTRHRQCPRPGPNPLLGGQGLPGRPRYGPGFVPRPMGDAFHRSADREPIPGQDPCPRRTSHGYPEVPP